MTNTKEDRMTNLTLWHSISDPDTTLSPKATKPVPGGAGLTAVDPFTVYMMATREWGPIGLAYDGEGGTVLTPQGPVALPSFPCWGVEEVESHVADGEHVTTVRFWYPHASRMRYVLGKGCTPITGGKGDKDLVKKSLTDATTNAMAKVGFGANVYLGHYNDSRYAEGVAARQRAQAASDDPAVVEVRRLFAEIHSDLANPGFASGCTDRFKAVYGGPYKALSQAQKDHVIGGMTALKNELAERSKAAAGG